MNQGAKTGPVALVILDGWGYREEAKDNAIAQANLPFFRMLWKEFPHSLLQASGEAVGLPTGQIGTSEIGHMTIGAGRVLYTDMVRITKAATEGYFDKNPVFQRLLDSTKAKNATLHIMGLVSSGGVHSHMDHLYALIRAAKKSGMRKIVIHAFLDGRDTPPQSGAGYLEQLELFLDKEGVGKIATVIGRYFAMDRDQNWDRIEKAESAIFRGEGRRFYDEKPSDIVRKLYAEGAQDEFMEPLVFVDDLGEPQTIRRNDGVFFFNFRADRARMLSKRIYERAGDMRLQFAAMTRYDKELPVPFLFGPENIATTLGEQIAKAGMTQVHIAETEKYAHATYFLNCGREQAYAGETDILVDSRKDVKTHDQAPEMRAKEITDKALESMEKGTDFIFINYANADMVGHTANKEAIICALETLDRELKRLLEGIFAKEGVAFITADHGNAEMNVDPETGQKHTAHTLDPVPAIVTSKRYSLDSGGLADIAPTILELLNLPKGEGMGRSLLAARNS